jgi:DNA polymerase delta subunit 3
MMDIGDDEVERVSQPKDKANLHGDVDTEEERPPTSADEPMEDIDDEPVRETKPLPKKRKPKKVIPVGKNGLKKKRLMKTRMREDDKGYQVTEDYSSYESVEEDDQETPKPPPKATKKTPMKPTEKRKADDDTDEPAATTDTDKPVTKAKPKPKAKATNMKPSGQSKLANFFGPKAKKT